MSSGFTLQKNKIIISPEDYKKFFGKKLSPKNPQFCSKKGWKTIAGRKIYFNSKAESNYARYLEHLKQQNQIKEWEYEPQTFWFLAIKRGVRSYLPDFKITEHSGRTVWIEVKGYMDSKSQTKIKRFKKYYPDETLNVVGSDWFKANSQLAHVISGWE